MALLGLRTNPVNHCCRGGTVSAELYLQGVTGRFQALFTSAQLDMVIIALLIMRDAGWGWVYLQAKIKRIDSNGGLQLAATESQSILLFLLEKPR